MLRDIKSYTPAEIEEKVLVLWKEKDVFEKSLQPKKKGAPVFNFWEGPPTANGRPGLHHVLARSFKDVFLRFKTMQGFVVPRKSGWDTHGLPVEIQVEKQLGLSSKKDIEKYGIEAFNQKCKESVWQYKSEWEKLTERMGYWLDLKHPYVTYENDYVETLWWIIKRIWDKGLLYQDYKIVNWCPRCGTGLSSHELAQGYKETTDTSVYVKFKVVRGQKIGSFTADDATYILSWTTTPWTLPGNVALAVGKNITYSVVTDAKTKQTFIVASDLACDVLGGGSFKKGGSIKGKDLVGVLYEPLFDVSFLHNDASYKVYDADFVTTTDGTGVVHTAVMYGEDDFALGSRVGLPREHTVDERGNFVKGVGQFAGMYVKDPKTEKALLVALEKNGNLLRTLAFTHEYPFCWRCDTPLLYYARSAWFIKMSDLQAKMLSLNKKINWVPSHIREGRFGEWLKEKRDWNFSRERYWGTPLPIWECGACEKKQMVGSLQDLNTLRPYKNEYFLLRHGQATSNVDGWIAAGAESGKYISHLTEVGKKEAEKASAKLASAGIDVIFASPYKRTMETAKIVGDALGKKVTEEKAFEEIQLGDFNHKKISEYTAFFESDVERLLKAPEGAETLTNVRERVYGAIEKIEKKYKNKKILIVGHGDSLWMLDAALQHITHDEAVFDMDYIKTGEFHHITPDNVPTNRIGEIDVHRPFIDEVTLSCPSCKASMRRVKEVADVWFDAGSMPFAQSHYPFTCVAAHKEKNPDINKAKDCIVYPADYIAEGIDQTRGWFYTLLAVSTLLGTKEAPYKNVISLGLVNDKNGQKMSKSRGNIVDPWMIIDKYGVDALRWYLFTINAPGDVKNFDEGEIGAILRRFIMTAYNSFVFLHTYGKKKQTISKKPTSSHILDKWILSRLATVAAGVGEAMGKYDALGGARLLEQFIVEDVSRWYIRRSRRRLQKPDSAKDLATASAVLAYVLLESTKLLAPFVPFFAESLYQSLKKEHIFSAKDSVHLEEWPVFGKNVSDATLEKAMSDIRVLASSALAKRSQEGIKVRQPLSRLIIQANASFKTFEELLDILADEINVKEIIFEKGQKEEFVLDTTLTPELKAEGTLRELIRAVQGLRQNAGYIPRDAIAVWMKGSSDIETLVEANKKMFLLEVGAKEVTFKKVDKFDAEAQTTIDGRSLWIGVVKR